MYSCSEKLRPFCGIGKSHAANVENNLLLINGYAAGDNTGSGVNFIPQRILKTNPLRTQNNSDPFHSEDTTDKSKIRFE